MNDTETDDTARELPPFSPIQETNARTTSAIENGIVTLMDGENLIGVYPLADIPVQHHAELAVRGLRQLLIGSHNPAAMFKAIRDGIIPGRAVAKPKTLDPRRKAVALANADTEAAEKNVKTYLPGGKKISPDYALILENAEQVAAAMSRADVTKAHKRAAVMIQYAKLIGE